jgi:2-polyprenyl-3-methyl-5-hydroxy-6-metoxy-1,4-benzoquinol methylase
MGLRKKSIKLKSRLTDKIAEIDLSSLGLFQGARVLDIGCARGFTMIELAKRDCRVFGIEVLRHLAKEASGNLNRNEVIGIIINGSADSLPFPNYFFDALICTEVIEHVPNAEEVLSEIHRVLRPGGRLCLSLPTWFTERLFLFLDHNFATFSGHLRIFRPGEMKKLLESQGFKILKVSKHYFEWSVYWLFRTLFLKTEPSFYEGARKYERLDYSYKRMWRAIDKLMIGQLVKLIGNCIFPKSHYFYCLRP